MSCVLLLGKENVFEGGRDASFVTFISIVSWRNPDAVSGQLGLQNYCESQACFYPA